MKNKEYIAFLEKLIAEKKYQLTIEELTCYFSDLENERLLNQTEKLEENLVNLQEQINSSDIKDESDKILQEIIKSIICLKEQLFILLNENK